MHRPRATTIGDRRLAAGPDPRFGAPATPQAGYPPADQRPSRRRISRPYQPQQYPPQQYPPQQYPPQQYPPQQYRHPLPTGGYGYPSHTFRATSASAWRRSSWPGCWSPGRPAAASDAHAAIHAQDQAVARASTHDRSHGPRCLGILFVVGVPALDRRCTLDLTGARATRRRWHPATCGGPEVWCWLAWIVPDRAVVVPEAARRRQLADHRAQLPPTSPRPVSGDTTTVVGLLGRVLLHPQRFQDRMGIVRHRR